MRISDWSSDVCSSDLDGRRLLLRLWHRRHGCGERRRRGGDDLDLRGRRSVGQLRRGREHLHQLERKQQFVGAGEWRLCRLQRRRQEEHTSELQSLMRSSYAVFCVKKKNKLNTIPHRRGQLTKH